MLVHILLYSDELGIANPLGAARGKHTLFVVYYSILNIHPKYRSQLRLLHIAIIAKYPDVKKHGLPATLRPLLQELSELQSNGITISVNGKDVCLKVSVLACAGDNLSMNRLGGFTCSFSRGSVCRFCMAQSSQLPTLTREGLCQVRTKELHQSHLTAVELNPALYKRLYGVNAPSSMSCLGNFDPTSQLPPDIMHDLFEGAFPFVVQHTVMGLLQDGILSESDLDKIATFQYGCNDRKNRPSELTVSLLKDKGVVTGTATQKWCLFRLLPQIFPSGVPEGNLKWEVYLLLREVADIILAYEMPADALAYLETKIQEFIRTFVECYPNQRLIPKLHYLIHYPRMISFFGPLTQVWCMRFEAKHQYLKNVATKVKNFRNISKTLAERHQLLQSYEFSELVFDEAPTMTGLKPAERSQMPACVLDALPRGKVWQAKSATVHHNTYVIGDVLVMSKGDEPKFAQICNIVSAQNEVVLLLEKLEVVEFRRHRFAFKVAKTGEKCVARPGDEAVHDSLDLYFGGEVVPKCEIVLLD
ncbi:hypothetical protein HPB48_013399 [Haemaphysalis longicornis]|uniref:Cr1-8 nvi n=1 Tax=Haemaphysalis longicornis TaxID=44386 RepID=A0A9J6FPY2_HAELO|nr:hypothetical protein HPB48_013399 [Haemaphysalis longicornis]